MSENSEEIHDSADLENLNEAGDLSADEDYVGENEETLIEEDGTAEEPTLMNSIAQPLADRKLTKKLYKLIKKSAEKKNKLYRGLKNVQTRIRKGGTGLCVLAGDVTPIDIYCHLPIVCEDKNIPYCFVQSKRALAESIGAKRPCIVALVSADEEYSDLYDKCYKKVAKLSC